MQTAHKPVAARRGIQSLETGLRVLKALATGDGPQTLSVIGTRAGVSSSQTHRYLQSLVLAGMAVQDASTRYDLGPAAISVGVSALARLDVFTRTEAALLGFIAETGRTAIISVWSEMGAIVVRWYPGSPPVHSSLALGSVLPLLHSATGHVFLSFLAEAETASVLARERGADHAVLTIDVGAIRTTVRNRLLCDSAPMMLSGLRAMAAPVFNLQGRLALVVSAIATPAFALEEDEAVAARLLAACQTATVAAGGVWPNR